MQYSPRALLSMPRLSLFILFIVLGTSLPLLAQDESGVPPEMQAYLETLTPSQQEQVIALLQGGVANGRWKEGLLFDGIAPSEDMFSTMQFYPGTEQVQPDEMRVSFMGTSPAIREDQSGMSILSSWEMVTTLSSIWARDRSRTSWRWASRS